MKSMVVAALCAAVALGLRTADATAGAAQFAQAPAAAETAVAPAAGAGSAAASPDPAASTSGAPASPAGKPAPTLAREEDPHAGLPSAVVSAIKELEAACRVEGGTATWTAKGLVGEVNFSRDGQPDYLIDTHGMECSASVTPWIGSDGFRHVLVISTGKGKWVRAFDRAARGLDITTTDGETRLILFSHSGNCTKPNPRRYQRCTQEYAWRRGKLRLLDEEWFTD